MTELIRPTLILNRLVIIRGNIVVYDEAFHQGVNVIYGKNAFGKSCIMDAIFYILGGYLLEVEWKEELKLCNAIYAEITINHETITLKRNITIPPNGASPMWIYEGDFISAISNDETKWKKYGYAETAQKESFSNVLFQLLGIPEVRTSDLNHAITMNSCLRLMYCDQRTPYFEIFRNEPFDNENKRKVISDLLCGIYNTDYYDLQRELKEKNNEYESLASYLQNVLSLLNKNENMANPSHFKNLIQKKESELQDQLKEFNKLRNDFYSNRNLENTKKDLKGNIEKIKKINADIESKTATQIKLHYEKIDSEQFIESLNAKLSAMEDAEITSQYIDGINMGTCPICFSHTTSNDDNCCWLCKSPISKSTQKLNIEKLKRNLLAQKLESQNIQKEREAQIDSINFELKNLARQKAKLQNDLFIKNTSISKNEIFFIKKSEEIAYTRKEIEDAEQKFKLSKELKEKIDKKENLKKEIGLLDEKIKNISIQNERKLEEVQNILAAKITNLLKNDVGGEKDLHNIKAIEINFEKNKLYVNERSNYAASSMGYIKNCFSLSLWMASIENSNFKLPRFMLLDNIEDKGIEADRVYNFQNSIKNFIDNSDITSQIIISASLLEENLRNKKFIIGKYYHNDETGKTLNFKSQIKLSDLISQ